MLGLSPSPDRCGLEHWHGSTHSLPHIRRGVQGPPQWGTEALSSPGGGLTPLGVLAAGGGGGGAASMEGHKNKGQESGVEGTLRTPRHHARLVRTTLWVGSVAEGEVKPMPTATPPARGRAGVQPGSPPRPRRRGCAPGGTAEKLLRKSLRSTTAQTGAPVLPLLGSQAAGGPTSSPRVKLTRETQLLR